METKIGAFLIVFAVAYIFLRALVGATKEPEGYGIASVFWAGIFALGVAFIV